MALDNKKQVVVILVAVVAGVLAVLLASGYIKSSIEGQTKSLANEFAIRQKQAMAEIQQSSQEQLAAVVKEMQMQKQQQDQATQKQIAALQEQMAARSTVPMTPQGTPQMPKLLALKPPPGKRAVTVQIDSLQAVGGLLNAGDFVDVIAELNLPSRHKENTRTVTAMIFQNLQVLAVNTNLNQPGDYDRQQAISSLKVTFAVDPQQVGLLSFADKNGRLQLALRAPDENQVLRVKASTWKTLADYVMKSQGYDIQNPDHEKRLEPIETKPVIEIFRGGKEL